MRWPFNNLQFSSESSIFRCFQHRKIVNRHGRGARSSPVRHPSESCQSHDAGRNIDREPRHDCSADLCLWSRAVEGPLVPRILPEDAGKLFQLRFLVRRHSLANTRRPERDVRPSIYSSELVFQLSETISTKSKLLEIVAS